MGVDFGEKDAGFHEVDDVDFSDSDLIYHVREALVSASSDDRAKYNQLVSVLHFQNRLTPDDVALLVTSLKALSGAVSCIDNVKHDSLLSSVFSMSMWNYGPDIMDALLELIVSLAASSGKYIDACLAMLVDNFTPPNPFINMLKQPRGISKKEQVLSRVHLALKHIAELVPLSPWRLSQIIIQRKPRYFADEMKLVIYVENMLKLETAEFGEFVRNMMFYGIMDLLLELDVEIGWDDILHHESSKGMFSMELEDVEETTDDELENLGEFPRELTRKCLGGNSFAEKLDSLMVLTFEHLESCEVGGRLMQVFEILLQSFQKTVLTAYKSKFAQFIMFYACALDPENCGVRFSTMLADMFLCDAYPPLFRMSAVAYLASYLSRGKFLSASFVTNMLKRLVDWCLDYCQIHEGEINPKAHRIFYSACQAIMYVLCFRMRSILDVPRLKSQLLSLPIDSLLKHNLIPLKVCLPTVVTEFLRQAKAARLFTSPEKFVFDDYLESELSKAFGGLDRLDMFFPFDPCLLKRSDSFIRPNFIYWSMVKPTYDDDDDDDEESSCDEDDDEVDMVGNGDNNMDRDLNIDEFDSALTKMSITPKDSLNYRFGGAVKNPLQMPSRIRPSTSPESL